MTALPLSTTSSGRPKSTNISIMTDHSRLKMVAALSMQSVAITSGLFPKSTDAPASS